MIIGVDMDSVIAEIIRPMDAFHNREYGTNLQYDDHAEWDLSKLWNCTIEEMFVRVFKYDNSPEFSKVIPIQGSQKVLAELSKKHSFHLITSRPFSIEKESLKWLNTFFPAIFNSTHHTNQISEEGFGKGTKKSVLCKQIHADIMIDDHIENVLDCADYEIKTLLFPAPWNRTYVNTHPFIHKINSWEEVTMHIR